MSYCLVFVETDFLYRPINKVVHQTEKQIEKINAKTTKKQMKSNISKLNI